jgi:hypothetical protein
MAHLQRELKPDVHQVGGRECRRSALTIADEFEEHARAARSNRDISGPNPGGHVFNRAVESLAEWDDDPAVVGGETRSFDAANARLVLGHHELDRRGDSAEAHLLADAQPRIHFQWTTTSVAKVMAWAEPHLHEAAA